MVTTHYLLTSNYIFRMEMLVSDFFERSLRIDTNRNKTYYKCMNNEHVALSRPAKLLLKEVEYV